MLNTLKTFKELTPELQSLAGGKGGMLARMFQGGYPGEGLLFGVRAKNIIS